MSFEGLDADKANHDVFIFFFFFFLILILIFFFWTFFLFFILCFFCFYFCFRLRMLEFTQTNIHYIIVILFPNTNRLII